MSNPSGSPRRDDFIVRGRHGPLASAGKGIIGTCCSTRAESRAQRSRLGRGGVERGGPWTPPLLMRRVLRLVVGRGLIELPGGFFVGVIRTVVCRSRLERRGAGGES